MIVARSDLQRLQTVLFEEADFSVELIVPPDQQRLRDKDDIPTDQQRLQIQDKDGTPTDQQRKRARTTRS